MMIRSAVIHDAKAIQKLNACVLGYSYPLYDTIQRLDKLLSSNDDRIFVAVEEDDVIGYVHATHYESLYFSPMKDIMGLAIDHAHQRKGVGRKLLEEVEMWAKTDGCYGVRLVSGAKRMEAHAFYHRCGYQGKKQQINFKKEIK